MCRNCSDAIVFSTQGGFLSWHLVESSVMDTSADESWAPGWMRDSERTASLGQTWRWLGRKGCGIKTKQAILF